MAQRKPNRKKKTPQREKPLSRRMQQGVWKLENGMQLVLVAPFAHDLHTAGQCYEVGTILAKVAKTYVDAGDARASAIRDALPADVVAKIDAEEGRQATG